MVATEAPARLSAEEIEAMSDEQIREYFEQIRTIASKRGIPVVAPKATSGAVTLESVLSRAAIFARANRASEAAVARRTETEEAYNTTLAGFLKGQNLSEVTPEIQEKITAHVNESLARARSGYEKTSATNKGKSRKGSNVAEAPSAPVVEGEQTQAGE